MLVILWGLFGGGNSVDRCGRIGIVGGKVNISSVISLGFIQIGGLQAEALRCSWSTL